MKIDWIEYLYNVEAEKLSITEFSRLMIKRGIELYVAESLDDFKRLHGSLDSYQGVLMHPGVERQEDIFEVDGEFPEIPLAIVSHLPEDYEKEKIPVFSYEHTDKMWSFLNQE